MRKINTMVNIKNISKQNIYWIRIKIIKKVVCYWKHFIQYKLKTILIKHDYFKCYFTTNHIFKCKSLIKNLTSFCFVVWKYSARWRILSRHIISNLMWTIVNLESYKLSDLFNIRKTLMKTRKLQKSMYLKNIFLYTGYPN